MPNLGTKPPMVEEAVEEELLTFIHYWGEKAHFYTLGRKGSFLYTTTGEKKAGQSKRRRR